MRKSTVHLTGEPFSLLKAIPSKGFCGKIAIGRCFSTNRALHRVLRGKEIIVMQASIEINNILSEIKTHSKVQEMKQFIQHGKVSTFEHCENVARLSYAIDKRLSLHSDLNVLLVGAMLHDFFLYDWHNHGGLHRLHGFTHAKQASVNAQEVFQIDDRTSRVIACHMWPLTLRDCPKSREEWIVCIADKCISLHETIFRR